MEAGVARRRLRWISKSWCSFCRVQSSQSMRSDLCSRAIMLRSPKRCKPLLEAKVMKCRSSASFTLWFNAGQNDKAWQRSGSDPWLSVWLARGAIQRSTSRSSVRHRLEKAGAQPLKREVRLEFGFFEIASPKRPKTKRVDHAKLQSDADKLYDLRDEASPVPGAFAIESFVLLWRIANERNSGKNLEWYQRALTASAARAMSESSKAGMTIDHILTSSVDLIAAKTNEHRVAYVGAFQVL